MKMPPLRDRLAVLPPPPRFHGGGEEGEVHQLSQTREVIRVQRRQPRPVRPGPVEDPIVPAPLEMLEEGRVVYPVVRQLRRLAGLEPLRFRSIPAGGRQFLSISPSGILQSQAIPEEFKGLLQALAGGAELNEPEPLGLELRRDG